MTEVTPNLPHLGNFCKYCFMGTLLCADIPFVFHNTELVPVCAFEGAQRLEAEIFGAVMQFARTGAPGWAASTEDVEQTMLFGPQSRLVQNHDHALIEALAPFTDLRMKKATRAGGQIQH